MANPNPPTEHMDDDLHHFSQMVRNLWADYGQTFMVSLLIVLIPLTVYIWYIGHRRNVDESAWRDLSQASSPAALADVADSHEVPAVVALARLAAADQLLYLAATPAPPEPLVTPEAPEAAPVMPERPEVDPEEALSRAATLYQQVADDTSLHPLYRLNALQGLASVAESQGRWDEARTLWQQVAQQAGEDYQAMMTSAELRLARLESIQGPVWFAPEPVTPAPATEAAPAPATDDAAVPDAGTPASDVEAPASETASPAAPEETAAPPAAPTAPETEAPAEAEAAPAAPAPVEAEAAGDAADDATPAPVTTPAAPAANDDATTPAADAAPADAP